MEQTTTLALQKTTDRPSLAERVVRKQLADLAGGQIELVAGDRTVMLGQPAPDGLRGRVHLANDHLFRRILLSGTIGAAESFMDGDWWSDDLTSLIRVIVRSQDSLQALESGTARIGRGLANLYHIARNNTRFGSRKNIAAHYDLGNDFFALMLDPSMTYSSAVFDPPDISLEQASIEKIDRLCRKLKLSRTDHLLEVGTGWGSAALHAASRYGCRVTTTTISREQYQLAQARVVAAGLSDRVEVLQRDYRDLTGKYDKALSIEMIEAVGADHLDTFFGKISSLLVPGGTFAMQAITILDQNYDAARKNADFIKRYIFPGSFMPSPTALLSAATRSSKLRLMDYDDITPHYARTLAAWRDNLVPHQQRIIRTHGERFWRMWMFYLAYCEASFAEHYNGCAQFMFERPRYY